MKIRLPIALAALLLALCLFSACGEDDAPFEAKEIAFEPVQTAQNPPPADRTLPVGDESRKLVYQYDVSTLSGETWEVYEAADGTRASFCKQNASLSLTAGLTSTVADAPKQLKTETDFLACVQEWVRLLAPEAVLSSYRYACTTTYLVRAEGEDYYGESKVANSFYRAQSENEEVESYLFTYTQTEGGFDTQNGVTVEMDGKGNLLAFRYDCYDADWAFSIPAEQIVKTVSAFIKTHEKEASHRASDVKVLEQHLAIVDGEVQLSVTVTAMCTPRDPSIEVAYTESFSLYLAPNKAA